jgi:hypothetical protein
VKSDGTLTAKSGYSGHIGGKAKILGSSLKNNDFPVVATAASISVSLSMAL